MGSEYSQHSHSVREASQIPKITDILPRVEFVQFGDFPVMYAGWGEHFTTDQMIKQWGKGEVSTQLASMITAYGFSGGYFSPDEYKMASPEARALTIARMAAIAESLMASRGWDHAHLSLATISQHPDIVPGVVATLQSKGIHIEGVKFFGLACDGGGGAMIDAIASGQGNQTVIVAAENLSGDFLTREMNVALSSLFGNGGGGVAIIPGKEISLVDPELVCAVVEKDKRGVIQIPRVYEVNLLRETHTSAPFPPWYKVNPNANFLYTDDGIIVNEMTTAGGLAEMSSKTGAVFKQFVVPLITDLLEHYYTLYPGIENKIDLGILHQPSKTILSHVAAELKKKFGERCPEIPWFMEGTGFNNISSGNIFIAMAEAARRYLLQENRPFLLGTYGMGLSAHAAIVQLNS